jgi:hypothetical protein
MSAVGMLLATDSSGSPFRLLPPPPEPAAAAAADPPAAAPGGQPPAESSAAAPAAAPRAPLPPPPPPPAAAPLGSRRTFLMLFWTLAAAAVVWPWRGAVAEDWLAGAVFLAAAPASLTFGERLAARRRAAGAALWLGALACFARYVRFAAAPPALETLIVAGFGALASGGAVYLAFWGPDPEEARWARALAPAGGLLLGAGAAAWRAADGLGWSGALAEAGRAFRAWEAAGGGWRWGSLAAAGCAAAGVRRLTTGPEKAAERPPRNWNL